MRRSAEEIMPATSLRLWGTEATLAPFPFARQAALHQALRAASSIIREFRRGGLSAGHVTPLGRP
jgi:hypothetical protein